MRVDWKCQAPGWGCRRPPGRERRGACYSNKVTRPTPHRPPLRPSDRCDLVGAASRTLNVQPTSSAVLPTSSGKPASPDSNFGRLSGHFIATAVTSMLFRAIQLKIGSGYQILRGILVVWNHCGDADTQRYLGYSVCYDFRGGRHFRSGLRGSEAAHALGRMLWQSNENGKSSTA